MSVMVVLDQPDLIGHVNVPCGGPASHSVVKIVMLLLLKEVLLLLSLELWQWGVGPAGAASVGEAVHVGDSGMLRTVVEAVHGIWNWEHKKIGLSSKFALSLSLIYVLDDGFLFL